MTAARLTRTGAAVVAGAAVVVASTLSAAAGPAATVKPFPSDVIKVQQSIGGIRIGESALAARKLFPAKDCNTGQCVYQGNGYSASFTYGAAKAGAEKLVTGVEVYTTRVGTVAKDMLTAKGVGIDSTAAAVRKAYPNARGNKKTGPFFIGSGKPGTVLTFFALSKDNVAQVSIAVQQGS